MSVALVTNYLPPYRVPLYRLLAERYGVVVYCFGGEGRYVPEAFRDLEDQMARAPFPVHRLRSQREAATLAGEHRAVIAASTGRVALPAAYRGATRARRPFILWASLWAHPRTAAHLLSYPLLRRIYRQADAVVTYGPHVSLYVSVHRGTRAGVFDAPQAVEPELFAQAVPADAPAGWRVQAGLPEGGPLVLFVGRLVREKGVDLLLRAWKETQDARAWLCLVGDGSPRGPGEAARVRFAGSCPRQRLPVAYAAADVVVVPSIPTRRFREPWGLVCNEAMSQGRPVIATDAVGAAAGGLVRDGETGLVVPAGDKRALARAIERLLADASLRESLGRGARDAVAAYSYERAADGFGRALDHSGVSTG
jgi:glycosyltransferase involved in cell wall biosynthesis